LGSDLSSAVGNEVVIEWVSPTTNDGENGIVAVHLQTPTGVVRVD